MKATEEPQAGIASSIVDSPRGSASTWQEIRSRFVREQLGATGTAQYAIDMSNVELVRSEMQPGPQGTPILFGVNQLRVVESSSDFEPIVACAGTHTVDIRQEMETISTGYAGAMDAVLASESALQEVVNTNLAQDTRWSGPTPHELLAQIARIVNRMNGDSGSR